MASSPDNGIGVGSKPSISARLPELRMKILACGLILSLGGIGPLIRCESAVSKSAPSQEGEKRNQGFKDSGGGQGFTEDKIPVSFHWYKSSDGVTVTTCIETYDSELAAKKGFDKRIQRANIIKRWSRSDPDGRPIGERVLVELRPDNKRQKLKAVYWTQGKYLRYVISKSQTHLLEFQASIDR